MQGMIRLAWDNEKIQVMKLLIGMLFINISIPKMLFESNIIEIVRRPNRLVLSMKSFSGFLTINLDKFE